MPAPIRPAGALSTVSRAPLHRGLRNSQAKQTADAYLDSACWQRRPLHAAPRLFQAYGAQVPRRRRGLQHRRRRRAARSRAGP